MRNLSSEKRARHRNVRIKIIYSRPGVILFSLRCCQGPLNRRGIYRVISLSELKGSFLVQSPNFTGEKTQAHLYKGSNSLWILLEDRHSGRNGELELDLTLGGTGSKKEGPASKGEARSHGKNMAYATKGIAPKRKSYPGQAFPAGRARPPRFPWPADRTSDSTEVVAAGQQGDWEISAGSGSWAGNLGLSYLSPVLRQACPILSWKEGKSNRSKTGLQSQKDT